MRSTPLTPGQETSLREASHKVASLEMKIYSARFARDAEILKAHEGGASIYAIAEATGLTRAYLGKMIKKITGAET